MPRFSQVRRGRRGSGSVSRRIAVVEGKTSGNHLRNAQRRKSAHSSGRVLAIPLQRPTLRSEPHPGAAAMTQKCIALLGRGDAPTDAIEEYCRYLSGALREHDFELELERVAWAEDGWPA